MIKEHTWVREPFFKDLKRWERNLVGRSIFFTVFAASSAEYDSFEQQIFAAYPSRDAAHSAIASAYQMQGSFQARRNWALKTYWPCLYCRLSSRFRLSCARTTACVAGGRSVNWLHHRRHVGHVKTVTGESWASSDRPLPKLMKSSLEQAASSSTTNM